MRKIVGITLLLGLLATTAGTALAQGDHDFRKAYGRGMNGFMLLMHKSMQKELKLSEDQIKKFEAYQAKQKEHYQGLQNLDPKERAKKLARASVEGEQIISETLTPEQVQRFKEVSRQQNGLLHSLEAKDGHIAAELKLTDDQRQKVKTIGDEMGAAMHAALQAAGGDRSKTAAKMQELRASANEKVVKLLTEEQKTKWKELMGEPFKVELNSPQGEPQATLVERLPPKIHKIQKELPAWIEKPGNKEKATAFMQKLDEQLKAQNFEEAEKIADSILKMLGESAPAAASPSHGNAQSPTASPGGMRLTEPAPLDFNDHEGYLSLFDGVSLKNWDGNPKFWRVENGAIIGESTKKNPSGNQYLVYRGFEAKDFTLKFEIKVDGNGGTGFQYRSKTGIPWLHPIPPEVTANVGPVNLNWMMTGPQADFWPTQIYTGQFYSENTPMRIVAWRGQVVESYGLAKKRLMGNLGDRKALGEWVKKDDWNQYTVIARGGTCIHIVNGQVMAVLIDDDPASSNNNSGLFGIEIELITKLYVKNIWVKKLN